MELRQRARAFVLGLLAELPRTNCWTIAEHAGDRSPDGMQHLLGRAVWDADRVRDDVRTYLTEQLGAGVGDDLVVLVVDETGVPRRAPRRSGCSAELFFSIPCPAAAQAWGVRLGHRAG